MTAYPTAASDHAPVTFSGTCHCGRELERTLPHQQVGDTHVTRLRCPVCRRSQYCTTGAHRVRDPEWVDPDAEVVF